MYTVKCFNTIDPAAQKLLGNNQYRLVDQATDYQAALVRSADLHGEVFSNQLLAIARAGAGVNNIPIEQCSEQGIAVFNTPGANANGVKELVLCGLLLSCRQIVPGIQWVNRAAGGEQDIAKAAEQAKKQFVGPELLGKKLGVIGLGAIGVLVANAASAGLGMQVMGYDPYLGVNSALHLSRSVCVVDSLQQLLAECDYITLHLPLNDNTRHMINSHTIQMLKRGAVILNYARGELVDNRAILQAVQNQTVRCYMTDFASRELVGQKGVVITPHLGASTYESEENCARMAAEEIKEYLENGNITHSVNLPDCKLPRSGKCRITVINRNITNMIGQITAVLADRHINIEHMFNKSRGAYAYTVIDVAEQIDGPCVEQIAGIDGVLKVRVL